MGDIADKKGARPFSDSLQPSQQVQLGNAREEMISELVDELSAPEVLMPFDLAAELLRFYRWNKQELVFWWTGEMDNWRKNAGDSGDMDALGKYPGTILPPPQHLLEACRRVRDPYLANL